MTQDSSKKSTASDKEKKQHLRLLVWLGILIRVLVASLALVAAYLPTFDSSADLILEDKDSSLFKRWIATSLRWDTFHFLNIAQTSYQYEYEWAFFPGVPILSRISGLMLNFFIKNAEGPTLYSMLLGHFLLSTALTRETTQTLYLLTLQHTQSRNISLLSACLSLLSSSPATLYLAPYTEPWFALLSYKGMLYCAQRQWLLASGCFSLASMFRSNGVLLGGFVIWGMVVEPLITRRLFKFRNLLLCIPLAFLPSLPFALHQLSGYRAFCTSTTSPIPSWCSLRLPLIYTHVQSQYWNSGFLRYWILQQLPNFLISAPVVILLLYSSITYILRALPSLLSFVIKSESKVVPHHPLLTPSLLPHAIHAFITTFMLLTAAHTQIILRLASSMPFTYWSAARLFLEHPKWAKAWVAWSIVWGTTSIVLWTAFLPPA